MIYLTAPLWLLLLLLVLYSIGVQYNRKGLPEWAVILCEMVAGIALVLDFVLNWTLFSLYLWELPRFQLGDQKPEWTFSDRIERLVFDTGWRRVIIRPIAWLLNVIDPNHNHIKNFVL
jgi:hypothetical protein